MSLVELPRRLALDFRDVTEEGLAFDSVRGDFELRDGNAYTDNLLLKGAAVDIGVAGRTGLGTQDYDQTVVVSGNPSGPLAVAGALAGGPGRRRRSAGVLAGVQGTAAGPHARVLSDHRPVVRSRRRTRLGAANDGLAAGRRGDAPGEPSMTRVAAIQMTSSADVDAQSRGRLAAAARRAGAGRRRGDAAREFRVHGPHRSRQARGRREPTARARSSASSRRRRASSAVDRRRHAADRARRRRSGSRPPASCSTRDGRVRGALRQDPPVRRQHPGSRRALSRVDERAARARHRSASTRPRAGSVWRSATTCGSRSCSANSVAPAPTGSACRPRSRRRPGARTGKCCCGRAPSRTSCTWSRRAVGVPRERPRDLRRFADRRLLGPRAVAAAARHRLYQRGPRPRAPARGQAQFPGARTSPVRCLPTRA